jgi:hypothetical protein
MGKKCDSCGIKYVAGEGWMSCPGCGRVLCPQCAEGESHEDRDIQKLRDGDAYTRMQVLCPSCSIEMIV